MWNVRSTNFVPANVGPLGSTTKIMKDYNDELEVSISTLLMQKTTLLWTARLLWKAFESQGGEEKITRGGGKS